MTLVLLHDQYGGGGVNSAGWDPSVSELIPACGRLRGWAGMGFENEARLKVESVGGYR